MKRQNPTSVSDLLAKSQGILEKLRTGSERADRTLLAVRQALPEDLSSHVWGAALTGKQLTILVDSAAWATRLRYHTPDLKQSVGLILGVDIGRLVIRVRPPG